MSEHQAWMEERNRILREMDIQAAFKGQLVGDVAIAALHKARYECTAISDELRQESAAYLKSHGMKRLYGMDFDEDSSLPI